jgi:uncharacterized membrane protein YdbT with pleckstrin-like domain
LETVASSKDEEAAEGVSTIGGIVIPPVLSMLSTTSKASRKSVVSFVTPESSGSKEQEGEKQLDIATAGTGLSTSSRANISVAAASVRSKASSKQVSVAPSPDMEPAEEHEEEEEEDAQSGKIPQQLSMRSNATGSSRKSALSSRSRKSIMSRLSVRKSMDQQDNTIAVDSAEETRDDAEVAADAAQAEITNTGSTLSKKSVKSQTSVLLTIGSSLSKKSTTAASAQHEECASPAEALEAEPQPSPVDATSE